MISGSICEIRLGLPGCGKSLDQTEDAVLYHLLNGEEVWCCYWINWNRPNYHFFSPKDFDAVKDLRNAVIVFDELAQVFDPRDWTDESGEVRSFFQLHRHRHIDIYANTQDVSLVAKTVGIIADRWIMCSRIEPRGLVKLFLWIFGLLDKIRVYKEYLTYQQLKKIAMGWEMGEVVDLHIEKEQANYSPQRLIHKELDEYKIELVHRYCPECCSRQGEQILKNDTLKICNYDEKLKKYFLKKVEYCPKHIKTQIEIRETGLYDTDYEPIIKPRKIKIKTYVPCSLISPEGDNLGRFDKEYKGVLSPKIAKKMKELADLF
jgi:hypothetical protein